MQIKDDASPLVQERLRKYLQWTAEKRKLDAKLQENEKLRQRSEFMKSPTLQKYQSYIDKLGRDHTSSSADAKDVIRQFTSLPSAPPSPIETSRIRLSVEPNDSYTDIRAAMEGGDDPIASSTPTWRLSLSPVTAPTRDTSSRPGVGTKLRPYLIYLLCATILLLLLVAMLQLAPGNSTVNVGRSRLDIGLDEDVRQVESIVESMIHATSHDTAAADVAIASDDTAAADVTIASDDTAAADVVVASDDTTAADVAIASDDTTAADVVVASDDTAAADVGSDDTAAADVGSDDTAAADVAVASDDAEGIMESANTATEDEIIYTSSSTCNSEPLLAPPGIELLEKTWDTQDTYELAAVTLHENEEIKYSQNISEIDDLLQDGSGAAGMSAEPLTDDAEDSVAFMTPLDREVPFERIEADALIADDGDAVSRPESKHTKEMDMIQEIMTTAETDEITENIQQVKQNIYISYEIAAHESLLINSDEDATASAESAFDSRSNSDIQETDKERNSELLANTMEPTDEASVPITKEDTSKLSNEMEDIEREGYADEASAFRKTDERSDYQLEQFILQSEQFIPQNTISDSSTESFITETIVTSAVNDGSMKSDVDGGSSYSSSSIAAAENEIKESYARAPDDFVTATAAADNDLTSNTTHTSTAHSVENAAIADNDSNNSFAPYRDVACIIVILSIFAAIGYLYYGEVVVVVEPPAADEDDIDNIAIPQHLPDPPSASPSTAYTATKRGRKNATSATPIRRSQRLKK